MEEKKKFNGSLDTAVFHLAEGEKTITELLAKGEIRIRPSELARAREYLKKMLPLIKSFHLALTEFDFIAPEEKSHE